MKYVDSLVSTWIWHLNYISGLSSVLMGWHFLQMENSKCENSCISWSYVYCHAIVRGGSVRGYATGDFVLVDQILYDPFRSSAHWSTLYRKGNPIICNMCITKWSILIKMKHCLMLSTYNWVANFLLKGWPYSISEIIWFAILFWEVVGFFDVLPWWRENNFQYFSLDFPTMINLYRSKNQYNVSTNC